MHRRISARLLLPAIVIIGVLALAAVAVEAKAHAVSQSARATTSSTPASSARVSTEVPVVAPVVAPVVVAPRDTSVLAAAIQQVIASTGASVGVTMVELGGTQPLAWSANGSEVFTAASTYKLAALMLEAQNIAAGTTDPNGVVCFQPDDYESGWFDDYGVGACF